MIIEILADISRAVSTYLTYVNIVGGLWILAGVVVILHDKINKIVQSFRLKEVFLVIFAFAFLSATFLYLIVFTLINPSKIKALYDALLDIPQTFVSNYKFDTLTIEKEGERYLISFENLEPDKPFVYILGEPQKNIKLVLTYFNKETITLDEILEDVGKELLEIEDNPNEYRYLTVNLYQRGGVFLTMYFQKNLPKYLAEPQPFDYRFRNSQINESESKGLVFSYDEIKQKISRYTDPKVRDSLITYFYTGIGLLWFLGVISQSVLLSLLYLAYRLILSFLTKEFDPRLKPFIIPIALASSLIYGGTMFILREEWLIFLIVIPVMVFVLTNMKLNKQ